MDINKVIGIVKETDKIFFDENLRNDTIKKGDFDFVTKADLTISNYLKTRLKEEFSNIGFMSEEEESEILEESYWILDPIDGTTNFMYDLGFSAVSLGLCEKGEMTLGVIYIPYKNEMYYAKKNEGAFLNGVKIECTKRENLADCLCGLEFNPYYKNDSKNALDHAKKIFTECMDIRTIGSSAIGCAYAASGKLDIFMGRFLKPWDYAAGMVIIKEAGGNLTDLNGTMDITNKCQHIVASNGKVHNKFLNLINK